MKTSIKIKKLIKKYKDMMKSHQIFMEEKDVTKFYLAKQILEELEDLLSEYDT